jgi:hypothetical protein
MAIGLSALGCNRAAVRIPGASLSFPPTSTRYAAQKTHPFKISVAMPIDRRADHYGERVAGTRWTGCRTDPFWETDATALVRERLVAALADAKLFDRVSSKPPVQGDLVLRSELDAFCSQAVGFLFMRVVGITALKIAVERDGQVWFEHKFERVVTDADPQYTGSQAGFIEQAMQVTMADSLRELLRDVLAELDGRADTWKVANKPLQPTRATEPLGKRELAPYGPRG